MFKPAPTHIHCEDCHLGIAPYEDHIRLLKHFFHINCWKKWYERQTTKPRKRIEIHRRTFGKE